MSKTTVEKRIVIWDDDTGCRIEVREDSDALDLVTVVSKDPHGNSNDITLGDYEDALQIASAITEVAHHIRSRKLREKATEDK